VKKNSMITAGGLILVALTCLPPTRSAAQSGLGIGPRVGYERSKDADGGEFTFGAALRARFLSVLGAEGSIDYRQEKQDDNALTVKSWPVMATGLVYPLPVLYGAVGAGWHNVTFDFQDPRLQDENQQEFGWHLGGGLEIPLGDAGALAADVRYVFLDLEAGELPEAVDTNADFYVITVALLMGSL
jgi:opacity protein-like surface antigen